MKLYYSATSPYAHKVRLVVMAKGLSERIGLVSCNPFENNVALLAHNPLGKVPALVLDDERVLFDSPVICEYLDSLSPDKQLIPAAGDRRWEVLRWQALADGIIDQAYNVVMERRRPEQQQSDDWLTRWQLAINHALDEVERSTPTLAEDINLAHLALIAALAYLDLRMEVLAWRQARPVLAQWYELHRNRVTAVGE